MTNNEIQKEEPYSKLKSSLIFGLAGLLGYLSSGVFYPLELIRIRLQVDETNLNLKKVIKEIYTKEGARGFYRGFYFTVFASGISNLLFFTYLEYLNNLTDNKGVNYTIKKQMTASYISGLTASLMTMPLWTIRTRISLLTLDKTESKLIDTRWNYFYLVVKESLKNEGILKLYKGFFSSIVLSFHGGIQMTIYETGKRNFLAKNKKMENYHGSFLGVVSKFFSSITLYPFNVIRAKQQQFTKTIGICLNDNLKQHMIIANKDYGVFYKTVKLIYNVNGLKGFYKGMAPNVIRQIPGSSVFFYTYEYTLKLFKINK